MIPHVSIVRRNRQHVARFRLMLQTLSGSPSTPSPPKITKLCSDGGGCTVNARQHQRVRQRPAPNGVAEWRESGQDRLASAVAVVEGLMRC
jgi:hypothetical protein